MIGNFTKNTITTIITQALQIFLSIGISIIIARTLGPEKMGVYAIIILLPTILITFTKFGIDSATVFYVGKKKYSPRVIFGNNIITSLLISTFAIIIGLAVILFFGNKVFPDIKKEYLLLSLSLIPFNLFFAFTINIFLGLQKIKKYNFIQLLHTFIFLLLIATLLLGFHPEIKTAIIANLLAITIICIFLFFLTKKQLGGIAFHIKKSLLKKFFSYGSKIHLINILSFLHLKIDVLMINIFLNPLAVGFYFIAATSAEKIMLISRSAGRVLFSRVSSETNKKKIKKFTPIVCRNVLWITILIAIFLFFGSRLLIILFYSEEFFKSILPFQILLIGMIGISGSRILFDDLAGRGRLKAYIYINIFSVILNIILNIILIPKLGITGAAWATTISYIISFLGKLIIYSKISGNKIVDIIFIKKLDLKFYKNLLLSFRKKEQKIVK